MEVRTSWQKGQWREGAVNWRVNGRQRRGKDGQLGPGECSVYFFVSSGLSLFGILAPTYEVCSESLSSSCCIFTALGQPCKEAAIDLC